MNTDLSRSAGVRLSPARPYDGGRTYYEMFVKTTGEIVLRSESRDDLVFLVRGKQRRRHPRAVANERRTLAHGTKYFTVENGQIVESTK